MGLPRLIRLTRRQKAALAAAITLLAFLIALFPPTGVALQGLDHRLVDLAFLVRGPRSTADLPFLLVTVDDNDVIQYGYRSPIPRTLLADVIGTLDRHGARCVAVDFVLDRPQPAHDAQLITALRQSRSNITLVHPTLPEFARWSSQGFSSVAIDSANVVRWYVLRSNGTQPQQSFALAAYKACFGEAPELPREVDPERVILNYYGPATRLHEGTPTFPIVSVTELGAVPAQAIRNRIVLVGAGFEDLGETFVTPYSSLPDAVMRSFGVELHATMLGMMIDGRFLRQVPWAVAAVAQLLFFAVLAFGTLFLRLNRAVLLTLAMIAVWGAAFFWAFIAQGFVLSVVVPVLLGVVIFGLSVCLLYFRETRYAQFLQSSFSRYLSSEVVREMIDRGWGLDLGGELRQVTVYFSDLRGFTRFSERYGPQEVIQILNEYLGEMTAIIFSERGTVGDYVGDAIMAYFGAPLDMPDQAECACRAALKSHAAMEQFNSRWRARGLAEFGMRVGIHSGEVVIGNIGSEMRRDFTIVGDAVNHASHLEEVNKLFGTNTVISESTRDLVGEAFVTRRLGKILVKGRQTPVTIYQLVGEAAQLTDIDLTPYRLYEAALERFYAREFKTARRLFKEIEVSHGDRPSGFMARECAELSANEPPETWNGSLNVMSRFEISAS